MKVALVFPHQLFEDIALLQTVDRVFLIEEYLFFKQYKFHQQKIAFHRASMKSYQHRLAQVGIPVKYIDAQHQAADIRNFGMMVPTYPITEVVMYDPVDDWLLKRVKEGVRPHHLTVVDSPQFLLSQQELKHFFKPQKTFFFQTTFYKQQRKKFNVLMHGDQPVGGRWTYDKENRKKYPKNQTPPVVQYPKSNRFWEEAVSYVQENFPDSFGKVDSKPIYPIDHVQSKHWLQQFLVQRFNHFGSYEDAMVQDEHFLHHSVLSPLINSGLLTPKEVIKEVLQWADQNAISINSTEGFIRQIIGWREFVRGMYQLKGSHERSRNYWKFKRKVPTSFYTATTGIDPVDDVIAKVLKTGYAHHIERLMVVGNFMLLCEIDPNAVYQWFMELFIDAYDWVMVPNIYGMSQFSDGGLFATKPYISSSNYIKKMSNYELGDWCAIWDALYWRFIHQHRDFFTHHPRLGLMVNTWDKMKPEIREQHFQTAEKYLQKWS